MADDSQPARQAWLRFLDGTHSATDEQAFTLLTDAFTEDDERQSGMGDADAEIDRLEQEVSEEEAIARGFDWPPSVVEARIERLSARIEYLQGLV